MAKMPIKKLKIDPEGGQSSGEGEMEQLSNLGDGEALAVTNVNSAVDDVGLGVFPEEIWLHVLDNVTHSPDILNVFKAFPKLDIAFHNKKAHWLFDQVLPHLMTQYLVTRKAKIDFKDSYVDSKRLLTLRLVSKRWKMVVESSIQNHADRHPMDSENARKSPAAAAVALPLNHFNYTRIKNYHPGASVFRTIKQINQCLNQMADFQGNPFPGKYVYFEVDDDEDNYREFAMRAVELLLKFGQHILFLDWQIMDRDCPLELCRAILKGLSSAPNLQSLKIWGFLRNDRIRNWKAANKDFSKAESLELFPKLEHLESFHLEMDVDVEALRTGRSVMVKHLIEVYGGGAREQKGLRKLALDLRQWNAPMATNLKNLAELHLFLAEMEGYNVEDIGNVLRMFPKGQLKKFCFSDYGYYLESYGAEISIDDLIEMMAEFEIENVVLERMKLQEKRSTVSAAGITSLHLDDSLGLSYEFLKRLPNLRFLSVYVSWDIVEELKEELASDQDSYAFKVRQYFWNVDKNYEWKGDRSFDIWKECGKLEMLTASVHEYEQHVFDVRFVREHGNKPFWGWNFSDEENQGEEAEEDQDEETEEDQDEEAEEDQDEETEEDQDEEAEEDQDEEAEDDQDEDAEEDQDEEAEEDQDEETEDDQDEDQDEEAEDDQDEEAEEDQG